jgi:hypothetical protein
VEGRRPLAPNLKVITLNSPYFLVLLISESIEAIKTAEQWTKTLKKFFFSVSFLWCYKPALLTFLHYILANCQFRHLNLKMSFKYCTQSLWTHCCDKSWTRRPQFVPGPYRSIHPINQLRQRLFFQVKVARMFSRQPPTSPWMSTVVLKRGNFAFHILLLLLLLIIATTAVKMTSLQQHNFMLLKKLMRELIG